ncbi:hypothetical protein HN011_011545 [Eciton burchellii]|nr:hypothetical protein HN011_011545 [Eciton burchellii]
MSTRCASDLSVLELKEELRKLGLTGTGCKSELIARLNRSTPSGTWSELQTEAQMSGIMVEVACEGSSHERPECGRERETTETRSNPQPRDVPETELEMMRRELELLEMMRRESSPQFRGYVGSSAHTYSGVLSARSCSPCQLDLASSVLLSTPRLIGHSRI